jgi:hypothetical protein
VTLFCLVAIFGTWQVFRRTTAAATETTKAALAMEELARHLSMQMASQSRPGLHEQARLLEQERHLQNTGRESIDSSTLEGGPSSAALAELEMAVGRLDATVGQMAASLANLVQLLEQRR